MSAFSLLSSASLRRMKSKKMDNSPPKMPAMTVFHDHNWCYLSPSWPEQSLHDIQHSVDGILQKHPQASIIIAWDMNHIQNIRDLFHVPPKTNHEVLHQRDKRTRQNPYQHAWVILIASHYRCYCHIGPITSDRSHRMSPQFPGTAWELSPLYL